MAYLYQNNVVGSLASPIGLADTSITLASGQGALFPMITGTDTFFATLFDAATKNIVEIVKVTAVIGDVLTVVRAQDGTTAKTYLQGDGISMRAVAAQFRDFASKAFGGIFASPIYVPQPAPTDNSSQVATTAWVRSQNYIGGLYTVSFNGRSGAVTLTSADVVAALGYTPGVATSSQVTSVFGRTGNVTMNSGDVTTALGYTPLSSAGGTVTGALGVNGPTTLAGNAGVSGYLGVQSDTSNAFKVYGTSTNSIGAEIVNTGSGDWTVGVSGASGPAPKGALILYDNIGAFRAYAYGTDLNVTSGGVNLQTRLYANKSAGGDPGIGIGRLFVQPAGGPVPAGMTEGDILGEY